MPISRRVAEEKKTDEKLPHLRPYLFHGLQLTVRGSHAVGNCPFCGRDDKFSVSVESGLWRCFVCGSGTERGGGNALVFLRLLHEQYVATTRESFYDLVRNDRGLISSNTVKSWGVCLSPDNTWLIPGYGIDGKLDQLYRRVWVEDTWRLLPTPGVWPEGKVHALYLPKTTNGHISSNVWVMEGPWDGMAIWETCIGIDTDVIAVPGCNVWRDDWTNKVKGKNVTLMFDSDHPRVHGSKTFKAGYDGMVRVAKKLSGIAASIRYIKWGEEGYDPECPTGYDVRDALSVPQEDRQEALAAVLACIEPVPSSWLRGELSSNGKHTASVEAQKCERWAECECAWVDALQWRQDMGDALGVLLAVCASTQQSGNQLFLQLVGSAGSGKTTLCEGLLVSQHCHHLEHLTGFHSGWREPGSEGKDCSLISRINGKTLVTPEADVLMSSPRFIEIMSQQRRIFDGKSGATFKNTSEDKVYSGLRTPWIMAGTPALLDTDQSRLGDRFIRCIINDPDETEKRSILRKALRSERMAMLGSANGTSSSLVDAKLQRAHALTGGYVDWLRANVEDKLKEVEVSQQTEEHCIDLAELSADMRARPNEDRRKVEVHDSKELPTRLARQNIRMATCLAVVLNKKSVDNDVLRIIRKVALDTAHGHTLNITRWLCSINPKIPGRTYQECGGLTIDTLSMWTGMTSERLHKYLMFLRNISVLEWKAIKQTNGFWTLTERVYGLYFRIARG